MGGKAVIAERTITFSEVITTKMACGDDRDRLERSVLRVLDGEVDYRVEADILTLDHRDGHGLRLRAG